MARTRASRTWIDAQRLRLLLAAASVAIATGARAEPGNRPERLEWFRDAGFGMFVHWSPDVVLGAVISHSLVGASADYARRYFEELPRSFNPRRLHPTDWATLARLAGMRYVVFTAKHHSGFCMFHTKTTELSVAHTPYGRDVTREVLDAFREQGIAVGLYFSPDDFHYLHRVGKAVARAPHPGITPQEDPGLLALDRAQLRELLTDYGPIDVVFLDGPAEGLRDLVWELQPDAVVTRGALETPEQRLPGTPIDRAWEACLTMGTQWQYKPTHETYKSGTELIELLIETRAKGGNLLLNVGPKPDGELPIEQEERLREIALWSFVNREAVYEVRPWVVTNEGDVWFTRRKGTDTVYAFLTGEAWTLGERRELTLRSVRARPATRVSVLGQSGEVLEYRPDVNPRPLWRQDRDGLHLSIMMAQRLHNDRRWPNPVVVRLTDVEPAFLPPVLVTGEAARTGDRTATLRAELRDLGGAGAVPVGFEYRRRKGVGELYEADAPWRRSGLVSRSAPGPYSVVVDDLEPGVTYEFRAVGMHPLLSVLGEERVVAAE